MIEFSQPLIPLTDASKALVIRYMAMSDSETLNAAMTEVIEEVYNYDDWLGPVVANILYLVTVDAHTFSRFRDYVTDVATDLRNDLMINHFKAVPKKLKAHVLAIVDKDIDIMTKLSVELIDAVKTQRDEVTVIDLGMGYAKALLGFGNTYDRVIMSDVRALDGTLDVVVDNAYIRRWMAQCGVPFIVVTDRVAASLH